jgi:outer membrane cobalamin receptor
MVGKKHLPTKARRPFFWTDRPCRRRDVRGSDSMKSTSVLWLGAILLEGTSVRAEDRASPSDIKDQIVVTASRVDLLGKAQTASQGSITRKEIELRPIYRPGQLFESIPGLVVTIHSGEGKANQYLIRGYNLDHGTDFANFVDDMPVNRPTNTHGQGYSDLAFLVPQVVSGIDYTKGPYYAAIGDFGSVASSHTRLANAIPTQLMATVGTEATSRFTAAARLTCRAAGACSVPSNSAIMTGRGSRGRTSGRSTPCCATARAPRPTARA